MAISRFSTSTVAQGLPKYQDVWDGVSAVFDSDYELIERITVGSTPVSSITFSSIPSTYRHLQIRGIARNNAATTETTVLYRVNGDTNSANYTGRHLMVGGGSYFGAYYDSGSLWPGLGIGATMGDSNLANTFSAQIVDLLDYANTSKFKTARCFNGGSNNTNGTVGFASSLWMSTAAINSVTAFSYNGGSFVQNTTFGLYGIKGA